MYVDNGNKEASELLRDVLSLIKDDIDHIRGLVKQGKLSHYHATDLSRYCKALQDLKENADDEDDLERKKARSMSTAELVEKAKERLKALEAGITPTPGEGKK